MTAIPASHPLANTSAAPAAEVRRLARRVRGLMRDSGNTTDFLARLAQLARTSHTGEGERSPAPGGGPGGNAASGPGAYAHELCSASFGVFH